MKKLRGLVNVHKAHCSLTEFVQFGIETVCFGGVPKYTTFIYM